MKRSEKEAVFLGTYLLMNAGYDTRRVAGFWQRVAKYREDMLSRNLSEEEMHIALRSFRSHGPLEKLQPIYDQLAEACEKDGHVYDQKIFRMKHPAMIWQNPKFRHTDQGTVEQRNTALQILSKGRRFRNEFRK
ncbi:hypothetical protein M7I_4869 [Glarea lozoyensis 74030]|nr:hypothetical protein M7I_4869 [Glarea lozoyensis 74030]